MASTLAPDSSPFLAPNSAPNSTPTLPTITEANINVTAVQTLTQSYQHSVQLSEAYAELSSSGQLGLPMPPITIEAQQALQFATLRSLSQDLHLGELQLTQLCRAMQSQQNPQVQQQQADVPKSRFRYIECPINKQLVIGFVRPEIPTFYFAFNEFENRMEPHKCRTCQTTVEETHLRPLYTEYCEALQTTVLFVFNVITFKREQYIYSVDYKGLEQVDRPEMIIDFTKTVLDFSIIGTLQGEGDDRIMIQTDVFGGMRKFLMKKNGILKMMVPAPVTTLMVEEIEKSVARKDAGKENGTEHDILPVRPLRTVKCPHRKEEVVYAFNSADGIFIRFSYDEIEADYIAFDCEDCSNQVTERFLLPKYTEQVKTENGGIVSIIHVYNEFTYRFEQYVYNQDTWGFEQVHYPSHPYDSSKDSGKTIVHIDGSVVILKDSQMRLRKEWFDTLKKINIHILPFPVKTLYQAMSGRRAMPTAQVKNEDQYDGVEIVAEPKPEVLEQAKQVVAGPLTPRVSEKEPITEEVRKLRKKLNCTQKPVTAGAPIRAAGAKMAKKKAAVRAVAMAAAASMPENGVTVETLLKRNADLLANPDKIMEQQANLRERVPRATFNENQSKDQNNK